MIIWINGAFGIGKSHTAAELTRRLDCAFLFDPEKVGFFLQKNLPNPNQYDDFQKFPLWRKQVLDNLLYCNTQRVITIVPMTIIEDEIFDYIIGGLRANGIDIRHFALTADKKTIEKRLIMRGDKNSWNFKQVDKCIKALAKPKYGIKIDTDHNNLDKVVDLIAAHCKLELTKQRLNWIAKKINWLKITVKNIR